MSKVAKPFSEGVVTESRAKLGYKLETHTRPRTFGNNPVDTIVNPNLGFGARQRSSLLTKSFINKNHMLRPESRYPPRTLRMPVGNWIYGTVFPGFCRSCGSHANTRFATSPQTSEQANTETADHCKSGLQCDYINMHYREHIYQHLHICNN
eukprot:7901212-Pyramimonas_sp.AAC.1